jgi:nucleoside-diphosphate kinase
MEKTLIILKPDAVARNLIGEIIKRFEKAGLSVIAMKMLQPDEALMKKHYIGDEDYIISLGKKSAAAQKKNNINFKEEGEMIIRTLREYVMEGPIVAMVLEGEDAIQKARDVVGNTDPRHAEKNTIRGDLGIDSIAKSSPEKRAVRNLIHASGNKQEAEAEIKLWFPEGLQKRKKVLLG